MENYMAEVAKMLGVELGEEFEIRFPAPSTVSATAVFNENGFKILNTDAYIMTPYWNYSILHGLLIGSLAIKCKPWRPKEDEKYYVVLCDGSIGLRYWEDCTPQLNYYKIGNFYKSKEEAEVNRDKWVSFYASDKTLEV